MRLDERDIVIERDLLLLLSEDESEEVCLPAPLTPSQSDVAEQLVTGLEVGNVCVLNGGVGLGKTIIVEYIAKRCGGALLCIGNFLSLLRERTPAALEETFLELIERQFKTENLVIIDDLHLLADVVERYEYPRAGLFDAVLTAIVSEAESRGNRLLFSNGAAHVAAPIARRAYSWKLEAFEPEDYRAICCFHLSALGGRLDYERIHRFADSLTGHQLKRACAWLRRGRLVTTESFIDYLASHNMASNVDVDEVAAVDWKDLKGVDDVIEELEAKIALPFENDSLANELQLKPKRGVLLAGPPGTGKTTIGRALAHRLRSKFFLIDGTVIAESSNFFEKVQRIFDAAKKNAPAIIFIDDADVIFEDRHQGFYRYLLTMMDGLESASSERVCIMMTAMDATSLPPALLRSGRIELWLYTRLPDEEARFEILDSRLGTLPSLLAGADLRQVARASRGFTGADLKALVEDAKLLFAHDLSRRKSCAAEEYFLRAIAGIRSHQKSYRSKRATTLGNASIGFNIEQLG